MEINLETIFNLSPGTIFLKNFILLESARYNVFSLIFGNVKIIKDDIYDEEDFLTRKTNVEFFEKFTEGDFGNLKDKMDLGVTRVFKGTSDIYDFLMTDEQRDKVITDGFPNFSVYEVEKNQLPNFWSYNVKHGGNLFSLLTEWRGPKILTSRKSKKLGYVWRVCSSI